QVRRHADFLRPLPRKEDGVGKARLRHRSTRLSFVPSGRLPANEVVAPGETGAERDEEDDLPSGDPTARDRLVERDGNRRRGRVPVTLEIEEDAFLGNGKLASDRLDDAVVHLMRDEEIDVLEAELVSAHRRLEKLDHRARRELEDLRALHLEEVVASLDRLVRRGRATASPWDMDEIGADAVASEVVVEDARLLALGAR